MTPVLWLDPVAAAAIAAGLTPAVGLGQLVCANDCARFGGKVPGHTRGSNWDWVPCPDCRGTGLVQPSGPTTMLIGATAVKPGKVGDWMMVPPSSVVTNGEWIAQRWEGSTCVERLRILPASILGTATIELVPVMDESQGTGRGVWTVSDAKARVRPDGSSVYPRLLLATDDVTADLVDISAALPFGSWTPGGLALIATDFRPTIDCPECDGSGSAYIGPGSPLGVDCARCDEYAQLACPLPWPAAPSSPCVTSIDLAELVA